MKIGVLICVLLLVVTATPAASEDGGFELAQCVPDCSQASFFIFSTSFGKYTIGNNGMGELGTNGKQRPFYLNNKIRLVGRLKQMYFREYQSDLLLLYQVTSGKVYLARMIQESKKVRWFTLIAGNDMGSCMVEGDEARCGNDDNLTKIDLTNGNRVSAN